MTATLISLLSILIGILGAYASSYIFKTYSFGLVGNTIAGVFGSILLIKSFGRIGFSPKYIAVNGQINNFLLSINLFISFIGGFILLILIKKLQIRLNQKR